MLEKFIDRRTYITRDQHSVFIFTVIGKNCIDLAIICIPMKFIASIGDCKRNEIFSYPTVIDLVIFNRFYIVIVHAVQQRDDIVNTNVVILALYRNIYSVYVFPLCST